MSLFEIGRLVATPRALEVVQAAGVDPAQLLIRHTLGDWGDIDFHDQRANERALVDGARLMSVYRVDNETIWIITEADRSVTTLLTPEDY